MLRHEPRVPPQSVPSGIRPCPYCAAPQVFNRRNGVWICLNEDCGGDWIGTLHESDFLECEDLEELRYIWRFTFVDGRVEHRGSPPCERAMVSPSLVTNDRR
jgi:hypothetical protein